jgi:ESCRT-I complex subunit TSG101
MAAAQTPATRAAELVRTLGYSAKAQQAITTQVSALFSASVGTGLHPTQDTLVFNDGRTETMLKLDGTIPIYYNKVRYNIPVSVWVEDQFPEKVPVCYVVPTMDMRVKKNHSCVDDQGLIFTAYLSSWNARSSNLTDLVSELSNRFSGEPPLFKYKHSPNPSGAVAAVDPKPVANPGPARVGSAHRPPSPLPAKPVSVEDEFGSALTQKVQDILKRSLSDFAANMNIFLVGQQQVQRNSSTIKQNLEQLKKERNEIEQLTESLKKFNDETDAWIAANSDKEVKEIPISELLIPSDTWSQQLIDAVAEDHAIEDIFYELDKFLEDGLIKLEDFLKITRKHARDQFAARLLAKKVSEKIESSKR